MNDLIRRQDAIELIHSLYPSAPIMRMNRARWKEKYKPYIEVEKLLEMLPSAQTETFEWCHDCKEYDQEKHCCHRWTKQIRKTVAELEADYPQAMKDELEYWKKRAEEAERKGKWIPREKYEALKASANVLSEICFEKEYLVRCKDCVYWDTSWQDYDPNYYYCPMLDSVHTGDFYCAYADIKE